MKSRTVTCVDAPWCALLIWLTLSALVGATDYWVQFVLDEITALFYTSLPFDPFVSLFRVVPRCLTYIPASVLFMCWFQPILLRLDNWRVLIWIVLSMLFGSLLIWFGGAGYFTSAEIRSIIAGQFFGLPGLACIGRRTRPWMSLAASGIAIHSAFLFVGTGHATFWYAFAIPNAVYGAIMLYGTTLKARNCDHPDA